MSLNNINAPKLFKYQYLEQITLEIGSVIVLENFKARLNVLMKN